MFQRMIRLKHEMSQMDDLLDRVTVLDDDPPPPVVPNTSPKEKEKEEGGGGEGPSSYSKDGGVGARPVEGGGGSGITQ